MIAVSREPIDIHQLTDELLAAAPGAGGIATFCGLVRADDGVVALTLEHYPGMTEKILAEIHDEACARWPVQTLIVRHRVGLMRPGEVIVFVGAAALHRGAALEAASYTMDQLKTRAAFWKKETLAQGERWVEARAADEEAAKKWNEKAIKKEVYK